MYMSDLDGATFDTDGYVETAVDCNAVYVLMFPPLSLYSVFKTFSFPKQTQSMQYTQWPDVDGD